jgi:hypothetical protein
MYESGPSASSKSLALRVASWSFSTSDFALLLPLLLLWLVQALTMLLR